MSYIHVVACAGSGKTSLLVDQVQMMVAFGTRPDQIRVFSYTRAAANEARERLRRAGVTGVVVSTLHSFAGTAADRIRAAGVAVGGDFAASRARVIGDVVAAAADPRAAAAIAETADMRFMCVDEAQDNDADKHEMCRLLLRLTPGSGALVVGDTNQSIFGFAGAVPALFEGFFAKVGRPVERRELGDNHRCPLGVTVAADAVMRRIAAMRHLQVRSGALDERDESQRHAAVLRARASGLYVPMLSAGRPCMASGGCRDGRCTVCEAVRTDSAPIVRSHRSVAHETAAVIADIRRLVESGVEPSDIAVLHRKNSGLLPYLALVSAHGINAVQAGESDAAGGQHVNLRTVHGSKGAEFSYVFFVGATDTNFPLVLRDEPVDDWIERELEELRLIYVGFTRAKVRLTVSFASTRNSQLTRFIGDPELRLCRHQLGDNCRAVVDDGPNDPADASSEADDTEPMNFSVDKLVNDSGEEVVAAWQASPQPGEGDWTLGQAMAAVEAGPLGPMAADPAAAAADHPACILAVNAQSFHSEFLRSLVGTCLSVGRGGAPQLGRRVLRQLLAPMLSAAEARTLRAVDSPGLRWLLESAVDMETVAVAAARVPAGGPRPAAAREMLERIDVRPLAAVQTALCAFAEAATAVRRDALSTAGNARLGPAGWARVVHALYGEDRLELDDLWHGFGEWDSAVECPRVAREVTAARRMLVGLVDRPPPLAPAAVDELVAAVMFPVAAADAGMVHRMVAPAECPGAFHPLDVYLADPAARDLVSSVVEQAADLGGQLGDRPVRTLPRLSRELVALNGVPMRVHGAPDMLVGDCCVHVASDDVGLTSKALARLAAHASLIGGTQLVLVNLFQRRIHSVDLEGWRGHDALLQSLSSDSCDRHRRSPGRR
jgi:hypothetical protein